MNDEERIAKLINGFILSITPKGTRILEDHRTPSYAMTWTICCNGTNDYGYNCGLKPFHSGKCHSFVKNVDFTRD